MRFRVVWVLHAPGLTERPDALTPSSLVLSRPLASSTPSVTLLCLYHPFLPPPGGRYTAALPAAVFHPKSH